MTEEFKRYGNLYTPQERKELIAMSIKTLRLSKNLSQKEIAEAIGVSTQSYTTYERGRNEAPAEVLLRIAMYFDVPLDMLMQRDNVAKDKYKLSKQLDGASQEIAELSKALAEKEMSPEEKMEAYKAIESLSKLADALKSLTK